MIYRKKLIEVALPLEDINREAAREKSVRHGHPSTLHLWWARRPLAACRAVLFASLVDDPSECLTDLLADKAKSRAAEAEMMKRRKLWSAAKALKEKAQDAGISAPDPGPEPKVEAIIVETERERLFALIRELVMWDNSNNERILNAAHAEIMRCCNGKPPPVYDPFCGGGSIPLEAQRLGLEAHASDLNPVPILINKALIEIPPRFSGNPPINPRARMEYAKNKEWKSAEGLAEDVRFYGQWMRSEAEKRIGHLYPKARLPKELGGGEATVIAWLWARTVKCPNPACGARAPIVRSFWLSKKKGNETYLKPVLDHKCLRVRFEIRTEGHPPEPTSDRNGATCLFCHGFIKKAQVREISVKHGVEAIPLATVVEGPTGRTYLPGHPTTAAAVLAPDVAFLEQSITNDKRWFSPPLYGLTRFADLFTTRQLIALSTFKDLLGELRELVRRDAIAERTLPESNESLVRGGVGSEAYAEAVCTYLAFAIDKMTDTNTTLCSWQIDPPRLRATFGRQALPMSWDFAEANIFGDAAGDFQRCVGSLCEVLERLVAGKPGNVFQADAAAPMTGVRAPLISTDPPYYDNIGYADLSDFFYVWLRASLSKIFPSLFTTVLVPKSQELIAASFRFGGSRVKAQQFFEDGLGRAFAQMREVQSTEYPLTVYYAFKQTESESGEEDDSSPLVSTGWETMLEGLLKARFVIDGTWPIRSELATRNVGRDTNALASSIVLVCRPRPIDARVASRRDFLAALKSELPEALRNLQKGNIAPVDLAQAAVGPGMAVFSRYAKVLETDGTPMTVRTALAIINQSLDEVLAEQEGEFDSDTRWALAWFDQNGFNEGLYGVAETLCTAKNTSVAGMTEAGILSARGGKVRLLRRDELPGGWDPTEDKRLTIWEATHQLIRALDAGEARAAELLRKLGSHADAARDLSYRLYSICERRKWAQDATGYNALVQSWSDVKRVSDEQKPAEPVQQELL